MMDRQKSKRMLIVSAILLPLILLIAGTKVRPSVHLPQHQIETATPTPASTLTPTPDLDRLLEPTLPAPPSQADIGAQDYWLNCMPCHGDVGQGLTDEFRQLYPPEDRGCWDSGCHGERHDINAWTLPDSVPPIIGGGILDKFGNAAILFDYVHVAMPWQDPSSLDDVVYWQLVAFLLRENGFQNPNDNLTKEKAQLIFLGDIQFVEETESPIVTDAPQENVSGQLSLKYYGYYWLVVLATVFLGMYIFFWTEQGNNS